MTQVERASAAASRADHQSLPPWRRAMKEAVREPRELCRLLRLPPEVEQAAARAARLFPLFVPRDYLARIEPANPCDPLLRQVLPLDAEFDSPAGFSRDPVGELAAAEAPGL